MLDSMFLISMLFSIHFNCCQFCLIQCFHFSCNNFQYSLQFFVTIFYIKFNINVLMFPSNSVLPHSMFFFCLSLTFQFGSKFYKESKLSLSRPHEKECQRESTQTKIYLFRKMRNTHETTNLFIFLCGKSKILFLKFCKSAKNSK